MDDVPALNPSNPRFWEEFPRSTCWQCDSTEREILRERREDYSDFVLLTRRCRCVQCGGVFGSFQRYKTDAEIPGKDFLSQPHSPNPADSTEPPAQPQQEK